MIKVVIIFYKKNYEFSSSFTFVTDWLRWFIEMQFEVLVCFDVQVHYGMTQMKAQVLIICVIICMARIAKKIQIEFQYIFVCKMDVFITGNLMMTRRMGKW